MGAKRVIVSISYAYIKAREKLSARGILSVKKAAELYHQDKENSCIMVVPWAVYRNEEVSAKKEYLERLGVRQEDILVTEMSINTFTDAQVTERKIRESAVMIKELVIIAEKYHLPRVSLIFKDRFPMANIKMVAIDVVLEADHPQFLQRNKKTWWMVNLMHLLLIRIFGVRSWVNKLTEPM